jgi:serine/threonine-protein kinase
VGTAAALAVGSDTTRLDMPVTAPAVRAPANGVPQHDGPVPPWATGQQPPGLSPNDRSARRLMLGAAVVVIAVAVGIAGGWMYMQSQIPSHVVPASLINMQRDALPAAIDDFNWEIRDETTRRDGTVPGQILETDPAAGEELREGSTLTVLVSQGPTLVDLPTGLAGMTADDARAALEGAGLVAELVPQPSEDVPEGIVIGFAGDDPGDQVPKGSSVALAVSTGEEFPMPDVTGDSYADAVATLEAAGLEVDVEDDSDDDTTPGSVMRTDPEAGDEVQPGDRVTIVVAVEEVEVPRLRGMRLDEATEKLEEEGLTVGDVSGDPEGRVLGTWPLEGTEVTSGTPVGLVMRPGR